jgi:AcrR family transcriptional regulator
MNEKKQDILNAALKLFIERGFHGASTTEIAKTAGVATGTLFHYFKTKEELINNLYLYIKENMLIKVSGEFDNKKTLKENLKLLWLKFIHFGINKPYQFQFILTFHTSPYITKLTKEQLETRTEELLNVYKKGIEQQEIKNVSFEMAIDYFWGNIVSTVGHFEKYPQNLNEKNINLAFELFWSGISK